MSPARAIKLRPPICVQQKEAQPVKRVPASERTRNQIEQLIEEGVGGNARPLSELMRLSVARVVEEALEAKVDELLGRGYYERRDRQEGSPERVPCRSDPEFRG